MNKQSHRLAIVFKGGPSAPAFSNRPAFSHDNVAKAGTNATFESQHFHDKPMSAPAQSRTFQSQLAVSKAGIRSSR